MSGEQNEATGEVHQEADFAQAFKELAKGERAAAALESHLDKFERQIEDLLAKADEDEQKMKAKLGGEKPSSTEDNGAAS